MLFNSIEFFFFFPLVTAIYFLLPHKYRWLHLLIASCLFYMAFVPIYILILFATIVIDYIAGILIENAGGRRRKWYLVLSLATNIGILCYFKYFNFFAENVNEVFKIAGATIHIPLLTIILPVGLSFHTFQAMSYTIEVYRGHQKAERHFGIYALYVMFYPQLVAGPIERPQNVLHQFHERHFFIYEDAASGFRLMLWGFIKKIVIADRLAIVTDPIFDNPQQYSGVALAMAALFFSFQIFCDFSGYSDIAIGAARVMGFKLMTNFNKPYHARSISEFWKRWHISLSTWFRDYLYISLGGNRVAVPRMYFNLFFVFLVSGFWHGANWTFIVWGALHGFYLVFALFTKDIRHQIVHKTGIANIKWLNNTLDVSITFVLVVLAWVFFRANTVRDAFFIVKKIIMAVPREMQEVIKTGHIAFLRLPGLLNIVLPCFGLILLLELAHIVQLKSKIVENFAKLPMPARWAVYYAGVLSIIYWGVFEERQFIYFQF
jgi:D-alanyl-lipoteichoic acid acyltransferase DltB (MBOAT superfamily)